MAVDGSIPACAGEPCGTASRRRSIDHRVYPRVCGGAPIASTEEILARRRVYPRVCGGAMKAIDLHAVVYPRVCGGAADARLDNGSIPACAGEPTVSHLAGLIPALRGRSTGARRVYPRVCGGAAPSSYKSRPPVGSIPACAGEPSPVCPRGSTDGGSIPACAGEPWRGPSVTCPNLRRSRLAGGSIPACAGEPPPSS